MVAQNTMRIEITGSTLQEFLGMAQKFQNGTITCEDNKAYWDFNCQVQQINQQQPISMQQPQKQQQKNAFLNMFDAMGNYF